MKLYDLKPKSLQQQIAINNAICFLRTGSFLYGTNTKDSDQDYFGVFIEPLEYRLGKKTLETVEFKTNPSDSGQRNKKEDLDCTFHSLDKFLNLLQNNNPNMLELLFVNPQNTLKTSNIFRKIIDNKNLFISKKSKHSFYGYAYSQMERNKVKSGNQTGRKDLVLKFGFDPKLTSHAVRLYTECLELLGSGKIEFPLYNNQKLIDIKNGLWPYEKIEEEFKGYEKLLDEAYIRSNLPHSPDFEAIHRLQTELYFQYYKEKGEI